MAITKLLKIKTSSAGRPSTGLHSCLRYIANPGKTENLVLPGGSCGGDPDLTYEDMLANKKSWDKIDGTQGYHYILSLPPDEHPDNETMRALTEDFCRELLQDKYLFAYAIHTDKGHLHSHIVFDSVSHVDGRMWKSGRYDWLARIQPITDSLCQKYRLRSLNFRPDKENERKSKYHAEWEAEKSTPLTVKKNVTWADVIRADVDTALSMSRTWSDFIRRLMDMHYDLKDGKHLSLRPEGKERFVRTGRLGEEYAKENLLKRIGGERKPEQAFGAEEVILQALREYIQRTGAVETPAGIKTVFYERWYAYSYVNNSRTPWKYKKDVTELGKYTDRCTYLFRHDITSIADLKTHINGLAKNQAELRKELARVNNQIYNTPMASWRKLEKWRKEMDSASEMDRPDMQKRINTLVASLKDKDIFVEAEKYHILQGRKRELQASAKKFSAELKLASELVADFDKSISPDDIMRDASRFRPAPFTEASFHRITINRVLFVDDQKDTELMRVLIPGSKEYILLYRADTQTASDRSYCSSYIYNHLQYRVVDEENNLLRSISGKKVMDYFPDRTQERRKTHAKRA